MIRFELYLMCLIIFLSGIQIGFWIGKFYKEDREVDDDK